MFLNQMRNRMIPLLSWREMLNASSQQTFMLEEYQKSTGRSSDWKKKTQPL